MSKAYVAQRILPAKAPPPTAGLGWSAAKIIGIILVAFWALAGLAIFANFAFNTEGDFLARYGPRMLQGLWKTIWITLISIGLGMLLAALLTAMRLSPSRIIQAPAAAFMTFFRGTPLIAQIFLIYYGSGEFTDFFKTAGLWWFFSDAIYCAILAFSLNTAAYQAQIYIGAIRTVSQGQREAGQALGLSRMAITRKIVLPQAAITALRPLGNEIVLMVKGSAIASVITVLDLMGETRLAYSRSFDFQVYLWAAVLYLVIVETLRRVWDVLEERLTRHLKR
jgi:polar amino acid transport system permease protein